MMTYSKMTFDTPIGTLTGIATHTGLKTLSVHPIAEQEWVCEHLPHLKQTQSWLEHYFSKRFDQLPDISLDLQAPPFTLSVWQTIRSLSIGEVSTYGALAEKIGKPKAAQATGQALKANPIILIIPCHRIIGQNQELIGFNAGIERKAWLLKHESSH